MLNQTPATAKEAERMDTRPAHTFVDPRIAEIVGDKIGVEINDDNIREALIAELGMDSMAKLAIVLEIKTQLDVDIKPDAITENLNTIGINRLVAEELK